MNMFLRILLGIAGAAIIFLGVNVGFGGIETRGWQGAGEFINVTDPSLYAIRDNHIRFIGGVWLGVGLAFFASAFLLDRMRQTILILIGMIFLGGVARLSALDPSILTSSDIAPSLAAEFLLFPLLGVWVWKDRRNG